MCKQGSELHPLSWPCLVPVAVKVKLKTLPYCDDFPVQAKPKTNNAFKNSDIVMRNQIPKHKPFQVSVIAPLTP